MQKSDDIADTTQILKLDLPVAATTVLIVDDGTPAASIERVQAQVTSLTGSFLERTRADVARLREMIERARRGERSVLEDIEHIAHSVHGSGAMFGFPEISMLGGDIERLVDGSMANTATPTLTGELAVLQQLSNHVERLAQEVQAAANVTPSSLGMFQGEAMADRTKS